MWLYSAKGDVSLIPQFFANACILFLYMYTVYIYSRYIFIIFINNSRRKDKGNQWHDGSCISGYKILLIYINFNLDLLV